MNRILLNRKMMKKLLVAFDFDDTLIDANSDLYIRKLVPNGKQIPEGISKLYSTTNWTQYMGGVFKFLHENGIQQEGLLSCIDEIGFVPGMKELLAFIATNNCDSIIISDSNSVFIDQLLQKHSLRNMIQSVYTNPAVFDRSGCLQIEHFHTQDWCNLSTINLCKGHILDMHISDQKKLGVSYETVAYVGDGTNDLCPTLRLKSKDVVFPRTGFRLLAKINSLNFQVDAKVKPWETGFEIMKELQLLF